MRYMRVLVLLAAFACTACAPQHKTGGTDAALEAAPLSPDAALAQFIGENLPGSSASFSQTRLGSGPVLVTVGKSYTSALNQTCRQARAVVNGLPQNLAACQQSDGIWTLAPEIFADGVF